MFKKSLAVKMLAVGALLAGVSYGELFTFAPTPADLSDLPHDRAYYWGIDASSLRGKEILSAKIVIDDLYNWKANENNALYVNLLNNAPVDASFPYLNTSNVSFPIAQGGVTSIRDDLDNDPFDWDDNNCFKVEPSNTNVAVQLDRLNYNWDGDAYNSTNNGMYSSRIGTDVEISHNPNTNNFSYSQYGVNYYFNGPTADVTIDFNSAEKALLSSYVADNGFFGIGVDADCHFYNRGFQLIVETRSASVPEPSLLTLLGCGLLGLVFVRRRK